MTAKGTQPAGWQQDEVSRAVDDHEAKAGSREKMVGAAAETKSATTFGRNHSESLHRHRTTSPSQPLFPPLPSLQL